MVSRPLTVQFYVFRNVHWPMFEALYEYLGSRPDVGERIICLPSLERLRNGASYALAERLLSMDATITSYPSQRPADITFVADTVAGLVRGCGVIVNVGHGTISKGYYFTDSIWTERENWVDLLCVPGDYAASRFSSLLRTRVVATGMPKLDPVFAGRHSRDALCRQLQIDPARRIVLYAPTFNEDLSSVYLFAERFAEFAAPDRVVLIKLHGSTKNDTVNAYRELATRTPGLVFVEDPNIAPSLGGADVMISDVSSVVMEFMALDKPVILFDNPNMRRYHGYNPEDIEHAWRDLGTRVDSVDGATAALTDVLAHGDGRSAVRQAYASRLFADRAGQASARVWDAATATLEFVGPPSRRPPLMPMISLLLPVSPDTLFLVRRLVSQVRLFAVMPIELRLVCVGRSPELDRYVRTLREYPPLPGVHVTQVQDAAGVDRAMSEAARASAGDYIMFVQPRVIVHRGFDYFLHKTFLHNPEALALTTLSTIAGDADRVRYQREALDDVGEERAAYHFINWHRGETVGDFKSRTPPPVMIFRRVLLKQLPDSFTAAMAGLANSGHLKVAASVFCAVMPGVVIEQARAYLRAKPAARPALALGVLSSGIFVLFADVVQPLLTDLVKAGATAAELAPIVPMALQGHRCDLATAKDVRALLKKFPTLVRDLDAEIAVLTRYLDRCRMADPRAGAVADRPQRLGMGDNG